MSGMLDTFTYMGKVKWYILRLNCMWTYITSVAYCETAVTLLQMHWSYYCLALSHQHYGITSSWYSIECWIVLSGPEIWVAVGCEVVPVLLTRECKPPWCTTRVRFCVAPLLRHCEMWLCVCVEKKIVPRAWIHNSVWCNYSPMP